ncbi:MAG: hypothetical protein EVA65_00935 [Oceanococcus sp.]|nr:MAG: hypothetical protein EVA65_00935 [Oceanococcus sp.]
MNEERPCYLDNATSYLIHHGQEVRFAARQNKVFALEILAVAATAALGGLWPITLVALIAAMIPFRSIWRHHAELIRVVDAVMVIRAEYQNGQCPPVADAKCLEHFRQLAESYPWAHWTYLAALSESSSATTSHVQDALSGYKSIWPSAAIAEPLSQTLLNPHHPNYAPNKGLKALEESVARKNRAGWRRDVALLIGTHLYPLRFGLPAAHRNEQRANELAYNAMTCWERLRVHT